RGRAQSRAAPAQGDGEAVTSGTDARGLRLRAHWPARRPGSAVRSSVRRPQYRARARPWRAPVAERRREITMNDQKNMILAVALSGLVLLAWWYFIGSPQMEKQKQIAQLQQQQWQQQPAAPSPTAPAGRPQPGGAAPQVPGPAATSLTLTREEALNKSPRISVRTDLITGSIAL